MAGKSTNKVANPPLDPNLRWLTIQQAAQYLQLSPQTVRNLIHDGGLKVSRLGLQLFRIDRTDLDAVMLRRKQAVAPYRRGTHPWVARRHAQNRKAAR